MTTARSQPRYRAVLADREYRAIFLADGLSVVGDQVTRLAVALLVFQRTGSSLLAAATYACSYLTWLLGGPVLSALADRLPRRRLMIACDVARALLVLVLVIPGLPLWALFAVLILVGLLAPPFDAARSALLADILLGERYVVGSALSSAVAQAGQVAGFLAGGALVALLGTSGALLVDASTFMLSALLLGALVRDRPVADRSDVDAGSRAGATSLRAEVRDGMALVARTPALRGLLGWGVLSAVITIAPEGLAVSVADRLDGGPAAAGVLTAAVPAGFLLGSWLVLRLPQERRPALFPWLVVLSAGMLMLSPLLEHVVVIALVWLVAGVGTALQLVANAAFVQAVPPHQRGRAFGVAGTALMAVQGVVLLGAGALADVIGPRHSVAAVAAAGLAVLLVVTLVGGSRRRQAQGEAMIVRGA